MTDPVSAAAHVFVDDLDRPELHPPDRHHLERVLRLRPHDAVTVCDGRGAWRPVRFGPSLVVDGPITSDGPPVVRLGVGMALLKGDRPELVVQKLTELGVDRVVPMVAARCVVRWDAAKAARHVERLRRVAREAAMQCRRTWLPEIGAVRPFAAVAAEPGACLAAAGGGPPSLDRPLVLVGPEGGWAPEERTAAPAVDLGPHVLRAETAAIAAGALLAALRAGLVGPPGHGW